LRATAGCDWLDPMARKYCRTLVEPESGATWQGELSGTKAIIARDLAFVDGLLAARTDYGCLSLYAVG
jgi:hypothetical protein